MKQCSKCRKQKPLSEFRARKAMRDGLCGECKQCVSERDAQRYARKHAEIRAKAKLKYERDPSKAKADSAKRRAEKREVTVQEVRRWREKNPEKSRASNESWRQRNMGVAREHRAQRKNHVRRATPEWANRDAIQRFYIMAKAMTQMTGVEHHVDHEIPLRGRLVCGLHNEFNLRVVPSVENLTKSNSFEVV